MLKCGVLLLLFALALADRRDDDSRQQNPEVENRLLGQIESKIQETVEKLKEEYPEITTLVDKAKTEGLDAQGLAY